MKTIAALILSGAFAFCRDSHAQSVTTNHGVIVVSNTLSEAEVIKIVSHLRVGMREEDAAAFLWTNKLASTFSVGAITEWDAVYTLSNGCSLHLDYRARNIRPNGVWGGNGSLAGAFIQSNGVNIKPIPLKGVPEPIGAANGSQPTPSQTNRTSSAAGSRR
jgi:hypothetical protein